MAFTYKIYAQGGTHVLATVSGGTVIGERTFNPGRLIAVENSSVINIQDKVTDQNILESVSIDTIYKEDGTTNWTVNNLNTFFETAIYTIEELKDFPIPDTANTYFKWDGTDFVWETITTTGGNLPPGGYLTELVDDTSPELGGNLTVNNKTIGISETVQIDNNLKLIPRTTAPTAASGGIYYNSNSDAFFVALNS